MKKKHKQGGFTLFELLLSVLLLSFSLFYAVPSFKKFYQDQVFALILYDLRSAIITARTKAILEGSIYSLSPLQKNHWSSGILLTKQTKGKEIRSHIWQWGKKNITIEWKGFYSHHYLFFAPSITNSFMNGSFIIKSKDKCVCLTINRLGNIRTDKLDKKCTII
ncbi:Tfp type 4 fimbrial pilin like signal peptide protein domain protein [Legionella adelaidensis]|uniref:Tfp type 4 fimbrial pilin like signal peptide protein domain protein n=1 Tax=Legionella adelaidensis TaxID=45056 RepID=A0A0W0R582_9GAMM|nr:hypothetical protein [Legionella adelaidensis]KTC66216.1 Tfp type 4 fimbrial pilin like signal peptide protein domain protein [Legionella adelaidensis]